MADLKLNTTNGSVTLSPEDGSGNVDVIIPRVGFGKVANVYFAKNPTEVSTTGTSPVTTITVDVPMDTDKYDYYVTIIQRLHKNGNNTSSSANSYILVDSTVVEATYHEMHNLPENIYTNSTVNCKISSGYSGGTIRTIAAAMSAYVAGYQIDTHCNNQSGSGFATVQVIEVLK